MTRIIETLIIGAGPAGLTTAYKLACAGREVVVLERDSAQVGGISRTVNYKNYLFDVGGHRFFSKSKIINDLWREILPDDFIERPRLSRIFYRKKFFAYPLRAFEALRRLGVAEAAACVASFAFARLFPIRPATSFHQWTRNAFGERLFRIFFKTYTEKVWGMSCDDISADWAAQRIKNLSFSAAVLDGLRRSLGLSAKSGSKSLIESFHYPRRGPGMMWEAAAQKIRAHGGEILLGRRAEKLCYDEIAKLWTVTARRDDGEIEKITARHVVSSAPLRELMGALSPTPISLLHARQLRYRDFLTVALIGKSSRQWPDNWIYIHDPEVKVGRVQNFRSWSPEMVPDPEMSCLGLEYFCFEEDGLWRASDADLIALAKTEIAKIGLMAAEDIVDATVVRQEKAYPVYDEVYQSNLECIRAELHLRFPNLHLVGRNGMHKYNNQDHAMMTGLLTAMNILAGEIRHDVWRVNEDAEYCESGLSGEKEALFGERLTPRKAA